MDSHVYTFLDVLSLKKLAKEEKNLKILLEVPQGNEQVFTYNEAHSWEEDFHSKKKKIASGTSLAVQWLRLQASTEGGVGPIPGWGTKIPHAMQRGQKKKKKNLPCIADGNIKNTSS